MLLLLGSVSSLEISKNGIIYIMLYIQLVYIIVIN